MLLRLIAVVILLEVELTRCLIVTGVASNGGPDQIVRKQR